MPGDPAGLSAPEMAYSAKAGAGLPHSKKKAKAPGWASGAFDFHNELNCCRLEAKLRGKLQVARTAAAEERIPNADVTGGS